MIARSSNTKSGGRKRTKRLRSKMNDGKQKPCRGGTSSLQWCSPRVQSARWNSPRMRARRAKRKA
jgi:hypothetical protein